MKFMSLSSELKGICNWHCNKNQVILLFFLERVSLYNHFVSHFYAMDRCITILYHSSMRWIILYSFSMNLTRTCCCLQMMELTTSKRRSKLKVVGEENIPLNVFQQPSSVVGSFPHKEEPPKRGCGDCVSEKYTRTITSSICFMTYACTDITQQFDHLCCSLVMVNRD